MRKNVIATAGVTALAASVIFACGSNPKPDTNTATATPTASAPGSASAATPATPMSMGDAGGSTTASAGEADAGMTKDQQCDALQTDAQSELDAERIKADKECKKDADCMPIKGRACQFICTNGSIPKAEQKTWEKAMSQAKDGACKKWADLGCKKPDAKPPTCSDDKKKPSCDKGHCTLK
jgi:hypothetical protein